MSRERPIVLLTRPRTQSREFAGKLGDADAVISPILEIVPTGEQIDPTGYEAIVFTSRNGVQTLAKSSDLNGRRAYVVGDATARVARGFGMDVKSADGNAASLVELIKRESKGGRLLHVHGKHTRGNVAKRLNSSGIDTDSVAVYDQISQPLTDAAWAALTGKRPVIVPLFSPRTAGLLRAELEGRAALATLVIIGISEAVLAAWQGGPGADMTAVGKPSSDAMAKEIMRRIDGLP